MIIKNTSYIRFLGLLEASELIILNQLNPTEERMMNYVMVARSKERKLQVGDLILQRGMGSPATLHGRLMGLVAKNYLKLIQDKVDGRKKFVIPTHKANVYYEKMTTLLAKAWII